MEKIKYNFTKEDMIWSIQDVAQHFKWDKTDKELRLQIWRMRSRLNMLEEILERND
ncbi:hypothetical protein [Streptococcus sanguinis]|jgi:hypothetical protein|uniref:hypothetical protein n=1 Tax=Streptococcus sanguinis TaxID=1305 RepID=UPI001639FCAD|nr:hypothetical protein [Streptococcus sanguinis]